MSSFSKSSLRVKLAGGVRYRWDPIRAQHHLLYPEGALLLNDTGAAIVKLCDGRPLEEIKWQLSKDFQSADLEMDVHEFLDQLADKGLVIHDGNS